MKKRSKSSDVDNSDYIKRLKGKVIIKDDAQGHVADAMSYTANGIPFIHDNKNRKPRVTELSLAAGFYEAADSCFGPLSEADDAYLQALASAATVYFKHGRQYGDCWYRRDFGARNGVLELMRKAIRLWRRVWLGLPGPEDQDKLISNAGDALNGAAFLLHHLKESGEDDSGIPTKTVG